MDLSNYKKADNMDFSDPSLISDIPASNQEDTGAMDTFLFEVTNQLENFKNQISSSSNLGSMDQGLLSLVDEVKGQLQGSVAFHRVKEVLEEAMDKAMFNGSEYAQKLRSTFEQLLKYFYNVFGNASFRVDRPTLVSMVRDAFGYLPEGSPAQSVPIQGPASGEVTNLNNQIKDNKEMNIGENGPDFANELSPDMAFVNRMRESSKETYKHLFSAKAAAETLYTHILDYKGDVNTKTYLINASSKMSKKLEGLIDLMQAMNYKIHDI